MAAVEAQACEVKTIISEAVPKDAIISSNTEQLFLTGGTGIWSKKIISAENQDKTFIYSEKYDISVQSDKLTDFYCNLL